MRFLTSMLSEICFTSHADTSMGTNLQQLEKECLEIKNLFSLLKPLLYPIIVFYLNLLWFNRKADVPLSIQR